jgi:hypothetical protein
MRLFYIFSLMLTASAANATCDGTLVFQCDINRKAVEVCLTEDAVTYRFGAKGKPELTLTSSLADADYTPWPGIGSSIWESIAFQNEGVTYEVWFSADRMTDEHPITGGIAISKNGASQAELTCTPGTVRGGLDAIYPAKTAIGQCFDREKQQWVTNCPEG